MFRRLKALLAAFLLLFCAGAAQAQPPVWVVKGHGSTLVLFGSVHLLPPGLDWRPQALTDAIAHADDLWFEIPLDDASALTASQLAVKLGMEPVGTTLSAQLSPKDRVRLASLAKQYGLPLAGLDRLKPWLAEVTLSVAAYGQQGAEQADGVEHTLSTTAPATIPRFAFETPEQQIGYLSQSSIRDQIASLRETLGELEEGRAKYDRLLSAWMAGDAARIQAEAVDPLKEEAPGVYKALVVDRNRRWVRAMQKRLAQPGLSVMVVGVGHLVGPDSVPALLRKRGLKVEGP
jgi:uncharacterized protein YbaP (TraB family)